MPKASKLVVTCRVSRAAKRALEGLARQQRRSLQWIIEDALNIYLQDRIAPLEGFRESQP